MTTNNSQFISRLSDIPDDIDAIRYQIAYRKSIMTQQNTVLKSQIDELVERLIKLACKKYADDTNWSD